MKHVLFTASIFLLANTLMADITVTRQAELMHFLKQDCGSCHGMTMKGGLGPPLLPESLDGKPVELLIYTIQNGRPGTAMPPWKAMLSDEDAAWLAHQLKEGVN